MPGIYYYWSDFADFYKTTYFFGVIEVLDHASYAAEVQVMLSDIVFTHVKPGKSRMQLYKLQVFLLEEEIYFYKI